MTKFLEIISRIGRHPLNRDQRAAALLRFFRWQLGSRLVPGAVLFSWIDGVAAAVERGDAGFTGNIYCGLLEFPEMAYVLHVVDEADLFVDVGANLGAYTLLACGARGASGVCFEPVPNTFRRLVRNLLVNDMMERVEPRNQAVGDSAGQLEITSEGDCENHVIFANGGDADAISVPVSTLDDALAGRRVTMLKIDVEGFETAVIAGADCTLRDPALHSVIMELNGSGVRYGYDETALVRRMLDYGFQRQVYDPFARLLAHADGSSWTGNTLFVKQPGQMLERIADARQVEVNGVTF